MSEIMSFSDMVRPVWAKDVTFELSYAMGYNGVFGYCAYPASECRRPAGHEGGGGA